MWTASNLFVPPPGALVVSIFEADRVKYSQIVRFQYFERLPNLFSAWMPHPQPGQLTKSGQARLIVAKTIKRRDRG
jgi:hypothetical protein